MVSTNLVVYKKKEDVQTQFQTDAVFHISVRLRRKESLGTIRGLIPRVGIISVIPDRKLERID